MTEHVRRGPFGPPVIEVAYLLADAPRARENYVAVLHEVDRPGLSFWDFIGAVVLAEALALRPEGRA
jgi:hypothetical protein